MAKKRSSSKKRPSSGGGRTPNTEPRVQVFSQFGGCNFQMSPTDFAATLDTDLMDEDGAQSDLPGNFMVIQNNAHLAPNKTIETRQNLVRLFDAPDPIPAGTVLFEDAFNRANGPLGDDWTLVRGSSVIVNFSAYLSTGPTIVTADQVGQVSDIRISAQIENVYRWIVFGVVDAANFWFVRYTVSPTRVELGRRVGDVQTILVSKELEGTLYSTPYTTVHIADGNIKVFVPEAGMGLVEEIDRDIAADGYTGGSVGFGGTIGAYIDNFRAMTSKDGSATNFTGVATLIGDELFAACDDDTVRHATLPDSGHVVMEDQVTVTDKDQSAIQDNTWTFLGYADDKLVGMTAGKQLWTGSPTAHTLENARPVPDPAKMLFSQLAAKGSLTISATATAAQPFRVGITYTHLNKYGPTKAPATLVFYASKPTSEWSTAAYVTVSGTVPSGYDIIAIELYYTEGEALEPAFFGRVTNINASTGAWSYNWRGYVFDTRMWTLANLVVPDQNYTAGVPASKMASHDGQLYFWGGTPEHRVWIGGNPGNRFSVSTGTGGGWVDCEPGTGVKVRSVLKYKTQQGASIVTMLCDNENSQKEHRFNLVENNISISNEQSIKGWQAEKISGTVGCKSPGGAVVANDGLYAISRYGLAITTLTMEYNSQLQVQYVSDAIEPVFTKQYGNQLRLATLFSVNDVLYMTFGSPDGELDNVIFCYDIGLKSWWTHTLDVDDPILNMIHIDHEDTREGIGVITANRIYLLPTTRDLDREVLPLHDVLIESPELSAAQPLQGWQHLTQLEFRFDYFIGDLDLEIVMIDQFGRKVHALKRISHDTVQYKLAEHIRIDKVVSSYRVSLKGKANMRLTHFMSKSYPKPNRVGTVWGFDSSQSHSSSGSIHRTFADYNDLKEAIIP